MEDNECISVIKFTNAVCRPKKGSQLHDGCVGKSIYLESETLAEDERMNMN